MQDCFILTQAVLTYIESHIHEEIEPKDLEQRMCVSYSHLREIFKRKTNVTLGKYILTRRIANAAFDLVHTTRKLVIMPVARQHINAGKRSCS